MKKRALITAALLLAFATQAEAKTLVFCSEASPKFFSPAFATTGTEGDITVSVFNRLIEFEPGTTKIIPGLAEKWDISKDGLTYTFFLRKGVKFQTTKDFKPTRNFNADDVMFTFERQWKKEHPYHSITPGANYAYFDAMGIGDLLDKIEKVDDYTVKITLKKPDATFISNLGIVSFGSIVSAEYADKLMKAKTPDQFDLKPVGTGPYMLVDYQKDATLRFKANQDYWKGKPATSDLVFAITPDASVRYAKLKANECQVMAYPTRSDLAGMKENKDLKVLEEPGLNIAFMAFHVQKKPLDDVRVRKALTLAINKKAIIDAIYAGTAIVAKNPLPQAMLGYNDAIQDYPYDPEAAKKLLAEAGLANGFETDLWAMPIARAYNPDARKMAEMIQADWAKIGVKAKIVSYEWGAYVQKVQAGEHQNVLLGWGADNGDPDNFMYTLYSCDAVKGEQNHAFWCNEAYDKLVRAAKIATDDKERASLYAQAQEVFHNEAPYVSIAHAKTFVVMRNNVEGFKIDPLGHHIFYGVSLK